MKAEYTLRNVQLFLYCFFHFNNKDFRAQLEMESGVTVC